MTVKCLNTLQQECIVTSFVNKTHNIDALARTFGRSRRTIIRVLEDAGIDPGIRRRMPKPTPLPQVIPTRRPWYRRILGVVGIAIH